jgi:hypothetical protein
MSAEGLDRGRALDHLQSIVQRLAGNSFSVKEWAITVVSAFLGFGIKDAKPEIAFVGILPIAVFWCVDAYYLASERHFRAKYNTLAAGCGATPGPILGQPIAVRELLEAVRTPVVASIYVALFVCCLGVGFGLFVLR